MKIVCAQAGLGLEHWRNLVEKVTANKIDLNPMF
jgi:hypothetical protein